MKRILFNLLVLVSLVAVAALLLAWRHTPWGFDEPSQRRIIVADEAWFVASRGPAIHLVRQRVTGDGHPSVRADPGRLGWWRVQTVLGHVRSVPFPADPKRGFLGFGWGTGDSARDTTAWSPTFRSASFSLVYQVLVVPYWALLLLAAAAPALWVRNWLRLRRRELVGQCPRCGYDLRASPDSTDVLAPRCPECGFAEGEEAETKVLVSRP